MTDVCVSHIAMSQLGRLYLVSFLAEILTDLAALAIQEKIDSPPFSALI